MRNWNGFGVLFERISRLFCGGSSLESATKEKEFEMGGVGKALQTIVMMMMIMMMMNQGCGSNLLKHGALQQLNEHSRGVFRLTGLQERLRQSKDTTATSRRSTRR